MKQEIVEKRLEDIKNGVFFPHIKGLENICFVKLKGAQKNKASRVYSRALKELHTEGGMYSEALLPATLKRLCTEQMLDISTLDKSKEIYKKAYEKMPPELRNSNKLTEEEIQSLSEEERTKLFEEMQEATTKINEYWEKAFSDKEREIINTAGQIEELSKNLRNNTYEHHARKEQTKYEIYLSAVKDESEEKFFQKADDIDELDPYIQTILYKKYIQFRNGGSMNFLSQ